MSAAARSRRPALTLIELLVVVAIAAVLLALVVSAALAVRESSNRSGCQNNLRQLALAVQQFHDARGTLPTYFGIYPSVQDDVTAPANPRSVYGGWFAHLLPYVGESDLHRLLHENVTATGRNTAESRTVTRPATGEWVPGVPGTEGRWDPPRVRVIDEPGRLQWVSVQSQNGYATWVQQLVGETWHWEPRDSVWVPGTPGRPGYWEPPGSGPRTVTVYEPNGIWLPEVKGRSFAQLLCPSDPSPGSDPEAGRGQVYARSQDPSWGSTNYLANWWALAGGDPRDGWFARPQPLAAVRDGLSNTIIFAEGYAWCDGVGRIALYPPDQHNFGLSQALPAANNRVQINREGFTCGSFPHGYPNTWMFQVRPAAQPVDKCPDGTDCCNRWVAQSPHTVLHVALLDGSTRALAEGLDPETWRRALQPRDGAELGGDW